MAQFEDDSSRFLLHPGDLIKFGSGQFGIVIDENCYTDHDKIPIYLLKSDKGGNEILITFLIKSETIYRDGKILCTLT